MAPPIKKRRIVAGQADAHTRPAPDLSAWTRAWSTESPVEAERAVDYLAERGIRARIDDGLKRHAALNTVEVSHVSVPATEVGLAIGLIEGRPDLFPGATSWSEPLRYRRGMWARVSQGGLPAQIGCVLFALIIVAPLLVALVMTLLYS